MKRWYVTMTWDDWPEGGSYGTVVWAKTHDAAEASCRREMADSRADEQRDDYNDGQSPQEIEREFADDWHVVDCFDLDAFIRNHTSGSEVRVLTEADKRDAVERINEGK